MKNKVGELIKILREKEHWSQEDLGEKLGVKKAAIHKLEKGLTLPTNKNIAKLSEIFRIKPDSFIDGFIHENQTLDNLNLYTNTDNQSVLNYFCAIVETYGYFLKDYKGQPEWSVQKNGKIKFYYAPLKKDGLKLCLPLQFNELITNIPIQVKKDIPTGKNGYTYPEKYPVRIYFENCELEKVKDFLDNILEQLGIISSSDLLEETIIKYAEFKNSSEYREQYKYDYAHENKGLFDNLDVFEENITNLKHENIEPFFIGRCSGLRHLTDNYMNELKEAFRVLFSNDDLENRLKTFKNILNEKLINDEKWRSNETLVDVKTASYFLFTNDYENNLLFTRMEPFNKFAKMFGLSDLVENKLKKKPEERYIKWQEYCKNTLLPKMDEVLNKKHTLLDAQDLIWFVGNNLKDNTTNEEEQKEDKEPMEELNIPKNQILYGPPGTGKTYNTVVKAMEIINKDCIKYDNEGNVENYDYVKKEFDKLKQSGQIEFVTFHQSYSYEEFVEGIKPVLENKDLTYKLEDGIFKNICDRALTKEINNFDEVYDLFIEKIIEHEEENENPFTLKTSKGNEFGLKVNLNNNLTILTGKKLIPRASLTKDNLKNVSDWKYYARPILEYLKENFGLKMESSVENKPHVLIIDEINRGDVSKIFGELITLIEEDKRLGAEYSMTTTLPYSKEPFGVPSNLFIIGTMNTADRSIALLDTALRRRFDFEEMMPKPQLLKDKEEIKGINLQTLLTRINERIKKEYDKDHQIGHSYLMSVNDEKQLERAYKNRILPLLNEYFYNDAESVAKVLNCDNVADLEKDFLTVLNKAQL